MKSHVKLIIEIVSFATLAMSGACGESNDEKISAQASLAIANDDIHESEVAEDTHGNSACVRFCRSVFGTGGPAAGHCISEAARRRGICFECGPAAPAGSELTLCGQACVNTQTDVNNCGSCGNVCPEEEECAEGFCTGDGWNGG